MVVRDIFIELIRESKGMLVVLYFFFYIELLVIYEVVKWVIRC